MNRSDKLLAEINKEKAKLLIRAEKKGLSENFGRSSVSALEGKYPYQAGADGRLCESLLQEFSNWCSEFELA